MIIPHLLPFKKKNKKDCEKDLGLCLEDLHIFEIGSKVFFPFGILFVFNGG